MKRKTAAVIAAALMAGLGIAGCEGDGERGFVVKLNQPHLGDTRTMVVRTTDGRDYSRTWVRGCDKGDAYEVSNGSLRCK